MSQNQFVVISLGGSIIVPNLQDEGGINTKFLKAFRHFLLKELKNGRRFIIVAGGGKTCRFYQKGALSIATITNEDLDWIGIHATRLNAHLIRTIFRHEAHPWVIDYDITEERVEELQKSPKKIFVASGWRPGWSTDYVAVRLAQKFHAKEFINASDIDFVYDKDPKKYKNAKPLRRISWAEFQKLIPSKWTPGLSSPIDPVAARLAKEAGLVVKILKAADTKNFKNAMEGKEFEGTTIS